MSTLRFIIVSTRFSWILPHDTVDAVLNRQLDRRKILERKPFDIKAYLEHTRSVFCFCAFLSGNPDFHHHAIAEDEKTVIFLRKYPTLPGYALMAENGELEISNKEMAELANQIGEAYRLESSSA